MITLLIAIHRASASGRGSPALHSWGVAVLLRASQDIAGALSAVDLRDAHHVAPQAIGFDANESLVPRI